MWQNLGRMYNVAVVLYGGPISVLPIEEHPEIGKIFYDHGGQQVPVNEHLETYPVDAFLVTHQGRSCSSATTPCGRWTSMSGCRQPR